MLTENQQLMSKPSYRHPPLELTMIMCMQYKLRGSEVVLPFNYSFLHLPAGPQCPSVTAAAPT